MSRILRSLFFVALLGAILARPDESGAGTSPVESDPPLLEASSDLGLDFIYDNGMSGELYLPEIMGGGVALLDYDQDGDLDVYLVQGGPIRPGMSDQSDRPTDRLFRNELDPARGTDSLGFVDVTEASGLRATGYGMGVVAADFDADGWTDLYQLNLGANQLWRNRGNGTFEDTTSKSGLGDEGWSVSGVPIDIDRDGALDLYVANYLDFVFYRHRKCRTETSALDYCGPLVYPGQADRLYRNGGDGSFEDVTAAAAVLQPDSRSLGVLAFDYDADGWQDLYVANDQMANHMWRNQGDGTFSDEALLAGLALNSLGQAEASMGVDLGDFDGDGDEDLFLTHLRGETNTLYENTGDGLFRDVTTRAGLAEPSFGFTGFGTAWTDVDNDGWLDLIVANGAVKSLETLAREDDPYPLRERNQLFRNRGDGRFEEITPEAIPALGEVQASRGLAVGDLDNDGDHDILISNSAAPVQLLINRAGSSSHWVGVELQATQGHAQAPGARAVMATATGRQLWRRVKAGGSYASSHDPRLLFAVREASELDREPTVTVHWPSGLVERFPVIVGRYQKLVEGAGRSPG